MSLLSGRSRNNISDAPNVKQSCPKWIVVGAGRLGRGLISKIAQSNNFSLSLVVEGKQTPQKVVDEYNELQEQGIGYNILGPHRTERCCVENYCFQTSLNTGSLIDEIAEPNTKVISISVGIEKLRDVTPWILKGIEKRMKTESSPLLILICENGRSLVGDSPSKYFVKLLKFHNANIDYSKIINVPEVIVDCAIPTIPKEPTKDIIIGEGKILIQEDKLAVDLLSNREFIRFVSDATFWQKVKLYGYNSLHCFISVYGYFIAANYVDEVLSSECLTRIIEKITSSLSEAIFGKVKDENEIDDQSLQEMRDYCKDAVRRIAYPLEDGRLRDPVKRAIEKVCNGKYFLDGRIDGPLIDLDLLNNPSRHPELVHTLSLCVFLYIKNIDLTIDSLPFMSDSESENLKKLEIHGGLDPKLIPPGCILHSSKYNVPLMEAIADDLSELANELDDNLWNEKELTTFLEEKINDRQIVIPRTPKSLQIRCVVFDMDEGLVATESLLYQVTHDIVKQNSKRHRSLSHDKYAECVGMDENSFFKKIMREYGINSISSKELVSLREKKYLERLEKIESGRLVKPGFRKILDMLYDAKIEAAIYSNASRSRIERTLDHVELAPYFKVIKSADDEGMECKPSPVMLNQVMHELKLKPINCIVVESSLIGMKAALAAGCYCVLLVHDYSAPVLVQRKGVEQLPNALKLFNWFKKLIRVCPDIGCRKEVSTKEWGQLQQKWQAIR